MDFRFGSILNAFVDGTSLAYYTTLHPLDEQKLLFSPNKATTLAQTIIDPIVPPSASDAVRYWALQAAASAIFTLATIVIAARHVLLRAQRQTSTRAKPAMVVLILTVCIPYATWLRLNLSFLACSRSNHHSSHLRSPGQTPCSEEFGQLSLDGRCPRGCGEYKFPIPASDWPRSLVTSTIQPGLNGMFMPALVPRRALAQAVRPDSGQCCLFHD